MKSMIDHLATYASYHRDKRNVLTHLVGIPMIVLSILVILSHWFFLQVAVPWGDDARVISLTFAFIAGVIASLYYLRLDIRYGLTMTILIGLGCWLASQIAKLGITPWWVTGVALFVVGWIFQFVGHYYEGKKPAFLDDLIGLIIGPLFVVAEVSFFLGLRKDVHQAVTKKAGPLH